MFVKILDVSIENVTKGKNTYGIATVAYMSNGEARTQKVVSFANPAVYKQLPSLVGKEVNVTMTKNDAGYNQWAAIGEDTPTASAPPGGNPATITPASGTAPVRVTGSNYETPAERAQKQVYIVKQSSISAAIALAANNKEKVSPADVVATAQLFVDYVFETPPKDNSIESLTNDIPY